MAQRIPSEHKKDNAYRRFQKKLIRYLWLIIALGFLTLGLIFAYLSFDDIPTFEELENPKYFNASIVYSNDGTPYGKYFVENRESITYDDLNPYLVDALVSTEDERYFQHTGIDLRALVRVATKTLLLGKSSSGGGSTITQQLAKLLFQRPDLSGKGKIGRALMLTKVKLKEWITAVKLERAYTKEEIMAMYLNKADFIYDSHGIQAASQTYFGKSQDKLDLIEAAVLVGMLKNPVQYNPRINPERSMVRRNVVLGQMERQGLIPQIVVDSLSQVPIDNSRFKREVHTSGPAPYARMELTKYLKDILADPKHYKPDGNPYNIYRDGLKIYTTIDLNYQRHAEQAMFDHMKQLQDRFFTVWKNKDPWEYGADKNQRRVRERGLNYRIRESGRYKGIWDKYFGELEEEIENKVGLTRLNEDILLLIQREESKPGTLDRMVRNKELSSSRADDYKKLLKSDLWPKVKEQFAVFEIAVRKSFQTKVKMKIFDYNEKGEKEVTMTPYDSVIYHRMHLQIGSLAVDPHTGHIKAWVGGINHKYFKFDHINSRRQVGSTFKPFVYATAIALQGISPCQEFEDIQYTIPAGDPNFQLLDPWSPSNANGKFTGQPYNLFQGLLESKNSISVKLMMLLSNVEAVRGLVHNLGIDSSATRYDGGYVIPKAPSICLGASDLTVMEMTGAYTAFANNGVYVKPILITRIEDKNGKLIYSAKPKRNVAINPDYNYVMVELLKNNISLAAGRQKIKSEWGGKTGTTNDYTDGWFMGVTPNLVVGTWVGGEDPWIRFLSLANGQGAVMARPFFMNFLESLENDPDCDYDPNAKFPPEPEDLEIELDCERYKLEQEELENDQNKQEEDELFFNEEIDL